MTRTIVEKPTKAGAIARSLADEIVHGKLRPGTPVDETQIAARYGVSRTPIREAIRQLTADGLLETRAHRGAIVRDFSEQQLDGMFAVMAELELLCARWAALAMTRNEFKDLDTLHQATKHLVHDCDPAGYALANERFHEAIYQGAHNGYLAELTISTRARLAPFRRAQFETAGRLARSFAEHGRVVAAIKAGDAAGAQEAMRAHITVVRTAVDGIAPERIADREAGRRH